MHLRSFVQTVHFTSSMSFARTKRQLVTVTYTRPDGINQSAHIRAAKHNAMWMCKMLNIRQHREGTCCRGPVEVLK